MTKNGRPSHCLPAASWVVARLHTAHSCIDLRVVVMNDDVANSHILPSRRQLLSRYSNDSVVARRLSHFVESQSVIFTPTVDDWWSNSS